MAGSDRHRLLMVLVNGMDYLLTWNCTHIANASYRPIIQAVCESFGYDVPVICTPEELQ